MITIQNLIDHLQTFENKNAEIRIWLTTKSQDIALRPELDKFISADDQRAYILKVS